MKKFAIGDIHGNYKALLQCLERSGFNKEEDLLISLGDILDGYSQSFECVQELLSIKNRIDIRGNHDDWFLEYIKTGFHGSKWTMGAEYTRVSYSLKCSMVIPEDYIKFFENQVNYYIDESNRVFVHGGFNRHLPIQETIDYMYYWDRDLWKQAQSCKKDQKLNTIDNFNEIFIGHTHVDGIKNPDCLPITSGGITNLDTNAGWSGKLTIMNIDTKEYFQSDLAKSLYNTGGR